MAGSEKLVSTTLRPIYSKKCGLYFDLTAGKQTLLPKSGHILRSLGNKITIFRQKITTRSLENFISFITAASPFPI
jgi:hypothetical protein